MDPPATAREPMVGCHEKHPVTRWRASIAVSGSSSGGASSSWVLGKERFTDSDGSGDIVLVCGGFWIEANHGDNRRWCWEGMSGEQVTQYMEHLPELGVRQDSVFTKSRTRW